MDGGAARTPALPSVLSIACASAGMPAGLFDAASIQLRSAVGDVGRRSRSDDDDDDDDNDDEPDDDGSDE